MEKPAPMSLLLPAPLCTHSLQKANVVQQTVSIFPTKMLLIAEESLGVKKAGKVWVGMCCSLQKNKNYFKSYVWFSVSMVSVCLASDALLQYLLSYLGFSYLVRVVSLHCCSSKAQTLLLTLDEGYLLTTAPPNLECGVAPLGPPAPVQPPWTWGSSSWPPPLASGVGLLLLAATPKVWYLVGQFFPLC